MTRGYSGLPAKVVRPPCAGALARQRLFRLLDRARRRPVVWVSGPPGSGKTTLISSYVEARRISCLWYRADGGDADAATFFHYMNLAARAAGRGRTPPLPVASAGFRPDPATFARRYFEELCARLPAPALIVVDDLHEIADRSPLFEVLRDGAECLPKGVSLVLASRTEPPPALIRLRARDMLASVGWDDLRLTAAETRGMAARRGMKRAGADTLRRLHALADGWAAGVVLMLSRTGEGEGPLPSLEGGAPSEIFEYFAEEVLARFDEAERKVLMAVSFLPETTPALAREALGLAGAGPLLAALARENAFVEKRAGAEPSYRFHSLFRTFLLVRAGAAFPPGEVLRLRRSAASALEKRGRPDEAEGLLREAQDWDGLSRLIRDHAAELLAQGRGQTLAEWLSNIPPAMRDADPWLSLWWARVRLIHDPDGSRRGFERAFGEFSERRDPAGVFLAWTGAVEAIIYGTEGLKPLDPWIGSLDGLLESSGGFPDETVGAATTLAMLKGMSLRRPPLASADRWVERALAVAHAAPDGPLKVEALVNLAYYWYHAGEFRNTETVLASLRKMAARPGSPPLPRLAVAWVEASHANMLAQYDRCLAAVAEGLDLAAHAGIHVMDYLLMGHGALAALHKGDAGTARDYLRSMEASLESARPWEAGFYHLAAGWAALGRSDARQAWAHADSSLALYERVGNPWTTALAHVLHAFLHHEESAFDASLASLAAARRLGERHGLAFARFVCLLTEAYFRLERNDDAGAVPLLAEGMKIGREREFGAGPPGQTRAFERLAAKSLEEGIEVEYVRALVRKNGLRPWADCCRDVAEWPWPFRIFTLGKFEIQRDGKPMAFGRKPPLRPLLLLKAVVALGGRGVPESRLIDLLWPESEGDMGRQAFRVNVLRLRTLLGHDATLVVEDGRLTLDDRYCWVDVWALERLCRCIDDLATGPAAGGKSKVVIDFAERAAKLYQGPFLGRNPGPAWASAVGQRIRNVLLRSLMLAGERMESEGDFESAALCYKGAVEADGSAEDHYQRLLVCYRRLGKVAETRDLLRKFPHNP